MYILIVINCAAGKRICIHIGFEWRALWRRRSAHQAHIVHIQAHAKAYTQMHAVAHASRRYKL